MDQAYKIIQQLEKKHRSKSAAILSEEGNILLNNNEVVDRWKRYIEKLYEGEGLAETDIEKVEEVEVNALGPSIMREEFDSALKSLQAGKAAGNDGIYIDFIKYSNCDVLTDEIFEIITQMYNTGSIPTDFMISKTVTLPKKLNTLRCEEHRTLSLISQASKILLKIIQNRIRPVTEEFLGPDQYGFRKHRGTREAIFALRMIIDRRMELSLDTHVAFIDLEKAFDKVNWKKMMTILKEAGLDFRDRRIIYELYRNQETIIEIGEENRKARIQQGVRQGCPLSPLIFNIFIECVIRKLIESGKGGVKFNGVSIQFVRFADDIAALADTSKHLEELITDMDTVINDFGLKININKTKTLITSKTASIHRPIKLNNCRIEQVSKFKYLGSIITSDSRCTQDIITRIAIAKKAFNTKKCLFKARISGNIRKRLIKVYIWSIALYGCETWTMTQRDRERLEAFEMWCWRRMEKISWTEKKSNEEVLNIVREGRSLLKTIENRRGKMLGHLLRHDEYIKIMVEGKVEGRRKRGRPRRTYMDQIKEKVNVVSYQAVKGKVQERSTWRLLHRQEPSS
jgi:hypothetical protein